MVVEKESNMSDIVDEDNLDEEPGEVIESAPPLKVGEERGIGGSGIRKKLLRKGRGWETPEFGDEVTVHFVGTLLDGTRFTSTRATDERLTFKLGDGQIVPGLDEAIITMKKGEHALFTIPPELGYGTVGHEGIPPGVSLQFEVDLISWTTIVDIYKDGGVVKKILETGERNEIPGDLDEVLVKYQATLVDGTVIAQTPEDGIEFYVKDGHLCPALPKALMTMKRGEKVKLIIQPQYALGSKEHDSHDGPPNIPPNSALNIDLQLVSFKSVIDVTGDCKVFKKVVKEGEGAFTSNEGATVTIRYVARLGDGTVYEKKGYDGEQPFTFVTDEEQVVTGLDRAASTMKKGEQAIVTINHEYGYGNLEVKRDLAVVPPCSDLVYEIEMLDFIKERAPWEMNGQERIEAARRNKEEGNLLFKTGKYQRAAKKYGKASDYASEDGSYGDDEQTLVKELRVSCSLNGAACCLKLNDFQGAVKLCSKVLNIESHNVKALYRRAQAYKETADLLLAELDVKKALEIVPNNREVKLLEKNLKQLRVENDRRDTILYSNMFARPITHSAASKKPKIETVAADKGESVSMEIEQTADSLPNSNFRCST